MSRIAIILENTSRLTELIALVRKVTGMSLGEIRERIQSGRPVIEYLVFYQNDDPDDERVGQLRELLVGIPPLGATMRVYDLEDTQTLATNPTPSLYEITPGMLKNMLDEYKRELEQREGIHPNE